MASSNALIFCVPIGLSYSRERCISPSHASLRTRGTSRVKSHLGGLSLKHRRLGFSMQKPRNHRYTSPAAIPSREGIDVSHDPTFYELLGLPQDVALPDIKLAYRQMALRYHPDVCSPHELDECTKRFMEVQEAYETLSDPRRRAMYDADISFGSRRRWDLDDKEVGDWRTQWEGQLSRLKYRNFAKDADSDSWGARMRRRQQQQT